MLPGVLALFRSVCSDTAVLLGHVNQTGLPVVFQIDESTGVIRLDPQLAASVPENRSKDILVVSLLMEILSAVIHRVASNFLVLVVWVRGFFQSPFHRVNVDTLSLEKKLYSKVLIPMIS